MAELTREEDSKLDKYTLKQTPLLKQPSVPPLEAHYGRGMEEGGYISGSWKKKKSSGQEGNND